MHHRLALVAADGSTYLVYALVVLLVAIGAGMVVVTVWLVRVTKPDPEALSALGVMGSRRFRREGTVARERHLEAMRGHAPADEGVDGEEGDGSTSVVEEAPVHAEVGAASTGVVGDPDEPAEPVDPDATGALQLDEIAALIDADESSLEPDHSEGSEESALVDAAEESAPVDADEEPAEVDEAEEPEAVEEIETVDEDEEAADPDRERGTVG